MDTDTREGGILNGIWWTLRLTLGLGASLAGLDKFFDLLVHWNRYIAPGVVPLIPMSPQAFMDIVGVIEMVVGLLILFTQWQNVLGWILAVWLWGIATNLILGGFLDIAFRDIIIGISAVTMARLSLVVTAEQRSKMVLGAPLSAGAH